MSVIMIHLPIVTRVAQALILLREMIQLTIIHLRSCPFMIRVVLMILKNQIQWLK